MFILRKLFKSIHGLKSTYICIHRNQHKVDTFYYMILLLQICLIFSNYIIQRLCFFTPCGHTALYKISDFPQCLNPKMPPYIGQNYCSLLEILLIRWNKKGIVFHMHQVFHTWTSRWGNAGKEAWTNRHLLEWQKLVLA